MPPKRKALRKGKKRAPLRAKTLKVSPAVKAYVKRTIHRDQENKVVNINSSTVFGNVLEDAVMNVYPILPYTGYGVISQGVGAGARIGNECKIRKVMLKYVLNPLPYSATSNPFPAPVEVDLFLGHLKGCPGELPNAGDFNILFQSGNTSFAPVGSLNDLISDVNNDYWTIKKRWRHKIGYSTYTGSGSIATQQYFANNDFNLNAIKKLDITRFVHKTMKFNDTNNTLQGTNLFFFYQAVSATGNVNTAATIPCQISFWIDIHYEDA